MREITVEELAGAIEQGAALVDVRELSRPVHVVCASGNRSSAMRSGRSTEK